MGKETVGREQLVIDFNVLSTAQGHPMTIKLSHKCTFRSYFTSWEETDRLTVSKHVTLFFYAQSTRTVISGRNTFYLNK